MRNIDICCYRKYYYIYCYRKYYYYYFLQAVKAQRLKIIVLIIIISISCFVSNHRSTNVPVVSNGRRCGSDVVQRPLELFHRTVPSGGSPRGHPGWLKYRCFRNNMLSV